MHEINTVMGEESLHHTGRYYDAAEPLYSGPLWDPPGCPVIERCPYFSGRFVHSSRSIWFGLQTVSSLESCPLFGVPFIKRFHYIYE